MGQEAKKEKWLRVFDGYQVAEVLSTNANSNWKFLNFLPRKSHEVLDDLSSPIWAAHHSELSRDLSVY